MIKEQMMKNVTCKKHLKTINHEYFYGDEFKMEYLRCGCCVILDNGDKFSDGTLYQYFDVKD
jgi:hypothetical protein